MYAVMFYVILNKRKLHFPLAKNVMHSPSIFNEGTKVQNPRRNSVHHALPRTVYYTAHARRVPRCPVRVGPRLYLACFTAVAPVASL